QDVESAVAPVLAVSGAHPDEALAMAALPEPARHRGSQHPAAVPRGALPGHDEEVPAPLAPRLPEKVVERCGRFVLGQTVQVQGPFEGDSTLAKALEGAPIERESGVVAGSFLELTALPEALCEPGRRGWIRRFGITSILQRLHVLHGRQPLVLL